MEDADIHFAFAENQEQVDKLLEVRETVPSITHIIYDDPRGLRKYEDPGLISTAELKKLGAAWDQTTRVCGTACSSVCRLRMWR